MFIWALIAIYFGIPFTLGIILDPSAGAIFGDEKRAKELDCRFVSDDLAQTKVPEKMDETFLRGDFINKSQMLCQRLILTSGDRPARIDALLASTSTFVPDIVRAAKMNSSKEILWRVETFHNVPQVAEKISTAVKVAMVESFETVVDEAPLLSANTIQHLQGKSPQEAIPLACNDFAETLSNKEKVLTLFQFHPGETRFHAGICSSKGKWQWLP